MSCLIIIQYQVIIPKNISININSVVRSSFDNIKNIQISDFLKKLKQIKSDNLQIINLTDNICGISNKTINHFEKIKNKYLNLKINKNITINNFRKNQNENKEESPLIIYYNYNLSITNVEDYTTCSKSDRISERRNEFKLLIIMTLILGAIFCLLLLLNIFFIKTLMNEYEYFMVKIWLLCTIFIILFAYFLIYFIKALFASILLFNYYRQKNKNCLVKYMFKIFIDKKLIYIFKIRNYITKYKREFINI